MVNAGWIMEPQALRDQPGFWRSPRFPHGVNSQGYAEGDGATRRDKSGERNLTKSTYLIASGVILSGLFLLIDIANLPLNAI